MEYIIDVVPIRKNIDLKEINIIKEKIKNNVIINNSEISKLLDYYIETALMIVEKDLNEDLTNNPLNNKCDLFQYIIGKLMEKDNIVVFPKESQNVFYPTCIGHSFLIVNIQGKCFIVDPSFRQFLTKESCDIKNFNTINDMVVKAPAPGFFMIRSEEGKELAKILIQNGFIMLNEEIAKIYGDSFYYTKTGYLDYSDIPADIYLNMLLKENTKYADSDDTFNEMYKIRI